MKKLMILACMTLSVCTLGGCGKKGDVNPPPSQTTQQ